MEEATLMREVADLEAKLTTLRTDAAQGRSALTALEGKLGEVSVRIAEARRTAAECEQRLEQARAELGGALREDAYRHAQNAANAIARELAETIERFLAVLAAYEGARGAVADARSQLAPSVLARLGPYDVPEPAEHEVVAEAWARLVSTVGSRADSELDDDLVEAAARSAMGHAISALPAHLRQLARRRREEYLSDLARSHRDGASRK